MRSKITLLVILIGLMRVPVGLGESEMDIEIYGGYHMVTAEDTTLAYNQSTMDYFANFTYGNANKFDDISISEKLSIDIGTNSTDSTSDTQIKPYEVFVYLRKDLWGVKAGLINIGGRDGIVLGHKYMTKLGKSYTGTYGNNDQAQPNLALIITPLESVEITAAYSSRTGDVSISASDNDGNISVINLLTKGNFEELRLGLEYESKAYENNNQNQDSLGVQNNPKGAESFLGLGLSFSMLDKMINPFINFGSTSLNNLTTEEIDTSQEINLGADILLTRNMGSTIGFERIKKTEVSSDKYYLGVKYDLHEIVKISGSYWISDQKANDGFENVKNQIDIELSCLF
jgi:hypothetical protein